MIIFILIALESVAAGGQSLALKFMIDGATEGQWTTATVAAVLGGLAAGTVAAAGRVYSNLQSSVAATVGAEINVRVADTTATMPGLEHLERPDYLDQVAMLRQGGSNLVGSLFSVTNLVSIITRLFIGLLLLSSVSPLLLLTALFGIPSLALTGRANRYVEAAAVDAAERRRAAMHLHGLFTNASSAMELRIFDCASALDDRAARLWRDVARIKLLGAIRAAAVSAAGWGILALGYVAALFFVAYLASEGRATAGDVVLVSQLVLQLRGQIEGATAATRSTLTATRLVDRYVWLEDYSDKQHQAFTGSEPVGDQLTSGIVLDDVSFHYPGQSEVVLRDIDLRLSAGTVVALVGENGAGKTTLLKLLCGFYAPTSGRITVGEHELRDLSALDWREHVAATFQDFLNLETAVRHSVGVGDSSWMDDSDTVLRALEDGEARAMVDRWSEGLDTHVGHSYLQGQELSGGQWQRLAVARSMMRAQPLLLILDEPTSALDAAAEHALLERYAGAARRVQTNGGIVILVSHRFSSVTMADQIVVLESGRVTEVGSHRDLLASGRHYAQMYRAQAAAYQ